MVRVKPSVDQYVAIATMIFAFIVTLLLLVNQ